MLDSFRLRCAFGFALLVGCVEASSVPGSSDTGGTAANGGQLCQAALGDLCERAECPTWDETVAAASNAGRSRDCEEPFERIYSAPCGNLGYVAQETALYARYLYFDEVGTFVAANFFTDSPNFCDDTSFEIWYGPIPDCERDTSDIWESFCKGSGFEHCSVVAECGDISESECLARYDVLECWAQWEKYVGCFSDGNTCERCAFELEHWDRCRDSDRPLGACATSGNTAVYAELDYIDDRGVPSTGTDAASAIGNDCLLGSSVSVPPVEGCADEAQNVVWCFPNCPTGPVDALASCVAVCTQDTIGTITGGGMLSESCVECYGAAVACGAEFCTDLCIADITAQACIDCRCTSSGDYGCTPEFVQCSGIPTDDC